MNIFNLSSIHSSWKPVFQKSLNSIDKDYLYSLSKESHWLPGIKLIFNAFSLDLAKVKYILIGESPYPRPQSAFGYAFWDKAVGSIWSNTGLSPKLNRATSLRHIVKMLLLCEGLLNPNDVSQEAIAKLNKKGLVTTLDELFENMLDHGFLLLNASLVYTKDEVKKHALHWYPFITQVVRECLQINPSVYVILFGKIAEKFTNLDIPIKNILIAEHPFNQSFMFNKKVQEFFKPLHLLRQHKPREHKR